MDRDLLRQFLKLRPIQLANLRQFLFSTADRSKTDENNDDSSMNNAKNQDEVGKS